MQIQPGGRPAATSSTKGLNLGGGASMSAINLNRGTPQIDAATLNTLVQLQNLQQQQKQQQATSGGRGGHATDLVKSQTSVDLDLQRMDSFDLDLLMKAQHDVSRQQRHGGGGGDQLAALLNGNKDALPYLNSMRGQGELNTLRGQGDLKPTAMGSTNPLSSSEPMTAMSMSNLRGVDDVGPSLQSMESARTLLANKLGGDFSTSAFSSSTTTRSNGGAAVSDSSFSNNYGDLGDVPPDFLVASPSDLSLLGQLQAFDQGGEVDYGQSPHPRRPMSYS